MKIRSQLAALLVFMSCLCAAAENPGYLKLQPRDGLLVFHAGDSIVLELDFPTTSVYLVKCAVQDFKGKSVWQLNFSLPQSPPSRYSIQINEFVKHFGFYCLSAEYCTRKGNSLGKDELSFALITPEVELKSLRPDSPFGIGTYFAVRFRPDQMSAVARLQQLLGASWMREELLWDICEPKPGEWKWTQFDHAVSTCRQFNISMLGLVDYWGKWAEPFTDKGYQAYANYVYEVVKRYRPEGELARLKEWKDGYGIRHWEVWNEPATFWDGTPEQFARLLKEASQAIKRADPQAVVFFANAGEEFDARVVKSIGTEYFDGVSPHFYCGPKSPLAGDIDKGMQETVSFYRSRDINYPLWITEMGWNTDHTLAKQRAQALHLVQSLVLARARGLDKILSYNFINDTADKTNEEFGIVNREDLTPKVAYPAYAALIHFLENARFVGEAELLPFGRFFVFSRPEDSLAVFWTDRSSGSLEIPELSEFSLFELMGNQLILEETETAPLLPLTNAPHYLICKGLKAQHLLERLRKAELKGIALLEIEVKPLVGSLNSKPPVIIELQSLSSRSIDGTVSLIPPITWKAAEGKLAFPALAPRQKQVVQYPMTQMEQNSENLYPLKVRVVTGEGETLEQAAQLSELIATRGTPRLDGALDDWEGARWLHLNRPEQAVGLEPYADWNLAARFALQWDDEQLYFAAEVLDNRFHQPHTGSLVWQGDNIQLGFNCTDKEEPDPEDPGVYQYGLSLTAKGPEVWCWFGEGRKETLVKEAQLVVKPATQNLLVYEASLPRALLQPLTLKTGERFGFSVLVNDNDGGGRKGWLEWTSGIGAGFVPGYFNRFELMNQGKKE